MEPSHVVPSERMRDYATKHQLPFVPFDCPKPFSVSHIEEEEDNTQLDNNVPPEDNNNSIQEDNRSLTLDSEEVGK